MIKITSITVKQDRIVCDVVIEQKSGHQTSPELLATLLLDFPNLACHTCKNTEGNTFSAVMDHTSLPHLLEHLVIELQAQTKTSTKVNLPARSTFQKHMPQISKNKASSRTPFTYLGTSEWLNEQKGRARVEVNFTDDLNALRAFSDAISILNKAMI